MELNEIKKKLHTTDYDFLRTDTKLGENVILLGLGGSHAYGTSTPNSDIDIRGIALNSKQEILLGKDFEQRINKATDTVIHSVKKMINMLAEGNPNTIEILGLKPEHYLYVNPVGRKILDNRKLFLSRKVIFTFGGYGWQQSKLLTNRTVRTAEQDVREKHVLNSIESASREFPKRYFSYPEDAIKLYVDKSEREDGDYEIFMDISLTHYPLRDYTNMWNDMKSITKEYDKNKEKKQEPITPEKLGKTMMHHIRAYDMVLDILEKEEVVTYREKEHDLYMRLRDKEFLDSNNQPTSEYWDLVREKEEAFEYAKKHTNLPERPDMDKIDALLTEINEMVVKA